MIISFSNIIRLSVAAATTAAAALPCAAYANVMASVAFSTSGLPGSIGGATAIMMPARVGGYPNGTTTADGVTISTTGAGAVVSGSLTNVYAQPVTSGTAANPTLLTSNYFSTGGYPGSATSGTVTLAFGAEEAYLGFLWGSVGSGDTISFYNTAVSTTVAEATFTGAQAQATSGYNNSNGAQGPGGSLYTLVNLTGGTFNEVVLSQTGAPSFEAGLFEYAPKNIAVPEPTTLALFSTGLLGLRLVSRRRKSR